MDNNHPVHLGIKLWIESDDGALLGPGRLALLEGVRRLGSLNKTAAEMRMSYRKAWGRLKDAENRLGQPLVVAAGGRKGYDLTELGNRLVDEYLAWQAEVENFALERARARFPWALDDVSS
ncbi:MAG: winged helix-turn-helix domain-containing protein [Desulfovibrionaceae bacterium]